MNAVPLAPRKLTSIQVGTGTCVLGYDRPNRTRLVGIGPRRIGPMAAGVLPAGDDAFRVPAETRAHTHGTVTQGEAAAPAGRLVCLRTVQQQVAVERDFAGFEFDIHWLAELVGA